MKRWHDIYNNPEDLPTKYGLYWVRGEWGSGKIQEGDCYYDPEDGYFDCVWNFNVFAWKEMPKGDI